MEDETTAFEEIRNDIGERQLMDESSEYNETISEEIMHVFNYNVLEYVVQGYFMPVVSLFGLAGNTVSIYILSHKDVKLKKDFSKVRWHTTHTWLRHSSSYRKIYWSFLIRKIQPSFKQLLERSENPGKIHYDYVSQ